MTEHQELAEFASHVVTCAGQCIATLRREKAVGEATKGGGRELVTAADLASNELIQSAIMQRMPGVQYYSEEGSRSAIDWSRPVWVVDPIDGTANYVYGQAHVGIALAYVVDGRVQVGVVHAPFQHETWVAVRGEGARVNADLVPKRATRPLSKALIATGFPHNHEQLDLILHRLGKVVRTCRDIRRLASPALDICWVAAGRLDAAYETLRPWDVAAAGLIAREACVARGHYEGVRDPVPDEVCGSNVVFARAGLLEELLSVLNVEA